MFEDSPEGQQMTMFGSVEASNAEKKSPRPGDAVVAPADVVMDRAFTVDASTGAVWPWLLQLGKGPGRLVPAPQHRAVYTALAPFI